MLEPSVVSKFPQHAPCPRVRGKFIFLDDGTKLYLRGVTYGTFRPLEDGAEYPCREVVEQDLAAMAANGINAVRTYTVPPRWLLDSAYRHGLRVMVGLSLERHVGFLADRKGSPDIKALVRAGVRACAFHPAVLCYAIANEIPASIVRWFGPRRIERYLKRLCQAAKAEDPQALVTYVNYPSTEYLDLPFLDLVCFNVYLESHERLEAYLARLQNIAGERPLVLTEVGLDSRRHGELMQAQVLDWQIRAAFAAGCAGTFVYAWTDEWFTAGAAVDDWDFGLTRRDRSPKPALAAVREAFAEAPIASGVTWPRISVVVCSYNGQRTIRDCLEGLLELEYPNFEVIVVDDGSTDGTPAIAREYGFSLITTIHRGLSHARNVGIEAATGEIVAFIDDDARPDPHWLTYVAVTFLRTGHVGVGGPNIAPTGDGVIAECVANAPGGPVHVLLSDQEAEHIPGCNMAFRKAELQAIGGFDPQFRAAGDDVDMCWRLRQAGGTLGFSPAAMVWHHRRNSVRAYWRQQQGYAMAEVLLERKWPERYNSIGHVSWTGRMYGKGLPQALGRRGRIYQGTWGTAPFQVLDQPVPGKLRSLPLMPEWYMVIAVLAAFSAIGIVWTRLRPTLPLLVLAAGAPLVQAGLGAARASFPGDPRSRLARLRSRGLTAILYLLHSAARLWGRLRHGLTPWRRHGQPGLSLPRRRTSATWTKRWQTPERRLRDLELALRAAGALVVRGGPYDRWDLQVCGGMLGATRVLMAVEEHGGGRQLVRVRSWPRYSIPAVMLVVLAAGLSIMAALDHAGAVAALFLVVAGLLGLRALQESARAAAATRSALRQVRLDGRGDISTTYGSDPPIINRLPPGYRTTETRSKVDQW
jgi:O-antigen biosynthesis protein